jgi:hypothetical protein
VTWHDSQEKLAEHAASWRDAGASHLSVNTMGSGLRTVDEHLAALEAAAEALKPAEE